MRFTSFYILHKRNGFQSSFSCIIQVFRSVFCSFVIKRNSVHTYCSLEKVSFLELIFFGTRSLSRYWSVVLLFRHSYSLPMTYFTFKNLTYLKKLKIKLAVHNNIIIHDCTQCSRLWFVCVLNLNRLTK